MLDSDAVLSRRRRTARKTERLLSHGSQSPLLRTCSEHKSTWQPEHRYIEYQNPPRVVWHAVHLPGHAIGQGFSSKPALDWACSFAAIAWILTAHSPTRGYSTRSSSNVYVWPPWTWTSSRLPRGVMRAKARLMQARGVVGKARLCRLRIGWKYRKKPFLSVRTRLFQPFHFVCFFLTMAVNCG